MILYILSQLFHGKDMQTPNRQRCGSCCSLDLSLAMYQVNLVEYLAWMLEGRITQEQLSRRQLALAHRIKVVTTSFTATYTFQFGHYANSLNTNSQHIPERRLSPLDVFLWDPADFE